MQFRTAATTSWVVLPFELAEFLRGWQKVVGSMIRSKPDGFSRDEWAYVIAFLDQASLMLPFHQNFGEPTYRVPHPDTSASVLEERWRFGCPET